MGRPRLRPYPYSQDEAGTWSDTRPSSPSRRTLGEWQYAADLACLVLTLDACHQFGLTEGGPTLNVDRAHALIEEALSHGIEPDPPDWLLASFVAALSAPPATRGSDVPSASAPS